MDNENSQEQQAPEQQPEAKAEPKAEAIDYERLAGILDGRQKATEESVLRGYFKDQGITGEEAAQAIADFKAAQAAKQPDVSGMQASIADLQRQVADAQKAVDVQRVENAVIVEAAKMGIDPKAIPYLTRMADLTDVGGANGISQEKVAAALSKVLDDLPALRPSAQEQTGFRVGGEGEAPRQADDKQLRAIFGVK
jgi:hypothetical protein